MGSDISSLQAIAEEEDRQLADKEKSLATALAACRAEREKNAAFLAQLRKYLARINGASSGTIGPLPAGEPDDGSRVPFKDIVLRACREILSDGRSRQTAEILRELDARGIERRGSNNVLYVSTIMSKSGEFDANRANGWRLKAPEMKEAENVGAFSAPKESRQ